MKPPVNLNSSISRAGQGGRRGNWESAKTAESSRKKIFEGIPTSWSDLSSFKWIALAKLIKGVAGRRGRVRTGKRRSRNQPGGRADSPRSGKPYAEKGEIERIGREKRDRRREGTRNSKSDEQPAQKTERVVRSQHHSKKRRIEGGRKATSRVAPRSNDSRSTEQGGGEGRENSSCKTQDSDFELLRGNSQIKAKAKGTITTKIGPKTSRGIKK